GLSEGMDSFKASDSGRAFNSRNQKSNADGEVDCDEYPGHKDCLKNKNTTPWQSMSDIAYMLLKMCTGLFLLMAALSLISWAFPPTRVAIFKLQLLILKAIIAIGLIVAAMGIAMIAMGQKTQGTIHTVLGALTTTLAYAVMSWDLGLVWATGGHWLTMKLAAKKVAAKDKNLTNL
ncbi:MAG: hypothetical protein ABIJ96_02615, partial [Elusimicrobiota bacterium]